MESETHKQEVKEKHEARSALRAVRNLRGRTDHSAVRIERQADNFCSMSTIGVKQLSALCVPQLACLVEGARDDLVSVRVVEGDGVDHVAMPF